MRLVLAVALVVAVLLPANLTSSGATFVAGTANPGVQLSTAADFNTVAVVLANPGSPLKGSVTLTATAASDRGIASIVFESAPAGTSTWSTACTDTVAPYACTFDTTAVSDGLRDVRAVATDTAGYSRNDVAVSRRVDNTGPTVSTTDPGSPLTGTVSVTSSASDAGSGLASVTLQYRATAGPWTDVCTGATSPLNCAWNTSALADGLWDLRTLAVDAAGNASISAPVYNRRVDNTAPSVTMTAPAATLTGTVALQSTSADGLGSGVGSVRYEYKPSAGSTWVTACTASSSPFSCSLNTVSVIDGLYDFRAVATDGVALSGTSATVASRRIDNTAPTGVTLGAVAGQIQGTVGLTATATDAGSGVANVRFQRAPAGTTTWTDICTDTTSAYTCAFDTTTAATPDALYDMRALATDVAGNTTASTVQTDRRIDNNAPAVAITSPVAGSFVRQTINVTGTATDAGGVLTTTLQYRLVGAATWINLCIDTSSPYSCPLNTTTLAAGSYEFRIQATDNYSHASTSAVVTATVDNVAPTAAGIEGLNGGTADTLDAGDTLRFGFSEAMAPASILTGWNGGATAVRVRVNNAGGADTLDVYDVTNTTKLALTAAATSLALDEDYVATNALYDATMVKSGANITITFGTVISGTIKTNAKKANMVWTPSTAATDMAGNACTATAFTEPNPKDSDF